ncbi:MAG: fibronectin type III domain-containing protein [Eubacterium sp.]|nr:fibronectin type III domain-containing protein [Eubacterium sp.]
MKKLLSIIMALIIALLVPFNAFAIQYDIVDENGEVVDVINAPDSKPFDLRAERTNEGWVKLRWDYDYWGDYYTGFEVFRYYPKKDKYVHLAYTTKNTYKVKDLNKASNYSFAVCTYVLYNDIKYAGAMSEPVCVSTAPGIAKLKKVKNIGTGKLTVRIGKIKKISGYMLQYSTSKKFKDGFTNTVFFGKKKTERNIKNLGAKTYYVRVRAYREVNGVKYFGAWSAVKSADVKYGVSLKTMVNADKTDLSGRKAIKQLTDGDVDIKKYNSTYDRIKAIYKWHAVHGLEFEHCLACNSHFNDCLFHLYGDKRKYDKFIWIDAGQFMNRDGSGAIHKWSVLYYSGIPFIFDPRLQSYTKDYDGTLYFGLEKGTSLQKRYKHEEWYGFWSYYYSFNDEPTLVMYHK